MTIVYSRSSEDGSDDVPAFCRKVWKWVADIIVLLEWDCCCYIDGLVTVFSGWKLHQSVKASRSQENVHL